MKPKYILIIIAVITATTAFHSCKDNPVTPEIKPGRRDYTWTVDTLNIPFTYLERIWGSSPTDVWAIGPGGGLDKTIFHFDGEKWNNDGISRMISPISIWGFGQNDVWLGGLEGRIWHFNGHSWKQSLWLEQKEFVYSGFMDIYGNRPDNIYTVGFVDSSNVRKGIIYHYNGKDWSRVNIAFTTATLTRIKRGLKTSENYFIRGIVESNYVEDTTKIFEFNGNSLVQLYSAVNLKKYTNFLQNINSEVVFVIGYSLNKYIENKGFQKFLDINNQNFGIQIFGRTEKDIFLRMGNGIAHYDGNNIKYLYTFIENNNIADGIIFKNEVFFLANNFDQGLNIIYKGILE